MKHSASCTVTVHATVTKVWEALTQPSIVKHYFFGTQLDTTWAVGSPIFFRGEWEGKPYEDRGTVLAFEPSRMLSFNYWSAFSGHDDVPDKRTIVRYSLSGKDNEVCVTVEQSNFDTQARADDSAKNWQIIMEGMRRLIEG